MVSKSMLSSLLQKQLMLKPESQPYFSFSKGQWIAVEPDALLSHSMTTPCLSLDKVYVLTWNIDFMASQPRARMKSALWYLEQLIYELSRSCAVIVHLQEMMESQCATGEGPDDLSQIRNAPWIQKMFNITDITFSDRSAPYSQATLVDRRLMISNVSRLNLTSEYQRDALFVDIHLDKPEQKIARFCNVHLDSSHGAMRPLQWKALEQHLQSHEQDIVASILAGDCNANRRYDKMAPQECGFKDAYLELGGTEGVETGATWGFQSTDGQRWGPQRLDKEVFWGDVQVESLERIGIGVQVDDKIAKQKLEEDKELSFVTDHYGLMGLYSVSNGLKVAGDGEM